MRKRFQITLDDFDLGQLLDGLCSRAEAWRETAEYMETGETTKELFVCEECNDADEARRIAEHYESIIANIERQMAQQRAER